MDSVYGAFVLLLQQRYLYYNIRVSFKSIPTTFGRLFLVQHGTQQSRVVLRAMTIIDNYYLSVATYNYSFVRRLPPTRDISTYVCTSDLLRT